MQYVHIVPPKKWSLCQLSQFDFEARKNELWVGRAELLLHTVFLGPIKPGAPAREEKMIVMALVSCLYYLNLPGVRGPMQKARERDHDASMFYEPVVPLTISIPVHNIIGRAPLMRTYIWGGDRATIPNAFAGAKDSQFELGRVDGIGLLGSDQAARFLSSTSSYGGGAGQRGEAAAVTCMAQTLTSLTDS